MESITKITELPDGSLRISPRASLARIWSTGVVAARARGRGFGEPDEFVLLGDTKAGRDYLDALLRRGCELWLVPPAKKIPIEDIIKHIVRAGWGLNED